MAEATTSTSRWRAFRTPDTAAAIYGTILAMAVLAAAARKESHGRLLALTITTLIVFWLAHVYAHALAHHLKGEARLEWSAVTAAMAEERPLLEGPAPMLLVLGLGLALLEFRPAVSLALWVGVAQLVIWGTAYARRQRWGWPAAVTAGVINGLLGLAIVVLEVSVK